MTTTDKPISGERIEELQQIAGDHMFMHAVQTNDWRGNLKMFVKGEGVWVDDINGNRLLLGGPDAGHGPGLHLLHIGGIDPGRNRKDPQKAPPPIPDRVGCIMGVCGKDENPFGRQDTGCPCPNLIYMNLPQPHEVEATEAKLGVSIRKVD